MPSLSMHVRETARVRACRQLERYFHDWRRLLHLGAVTLIVQNDDDGEADEDDNGAPIRPRRCMA